MLPKRKDLKSFLPIVKINALDGKITRSDRVQDEDGNRATQAHEIPVDDFEFIPDMPNLEIGWIHFGGNGQAPDFRMKLAEGFDNDIGDRPGDKFKEGFRLRVKLTSGAGDDVRELASTSIGLWKSIDELHDLYAEGVEKNEGRLPLVGIREMITVEGKMTTTFRPDFEILKWVLRPPDLVETPLGRDCKGSAHATSEARDPVPVPLTRPRPEPPYTAPGAHRQTHTAAMSSYHVTHRIGTCRRRDVRFPVQAARQSAGDTSRLQRRYHRSSTDQAMVGARATIQHRYCHRHAVRHFRPTNYLPRVAPSFSS